MEKQLFCQAIPKIELHAHLNGSLSPACLQKLGCSNEDIKQYQKLTKLLKTREKALEECFPLFKIAQSVTTTCQSVYQATKCVIEEFYNDNVVYLELRTTAREEHNMTKAEYIESVVQAIQDTEKNIITKLLLSVDRRHDLKTSEESMELFILMKTKYPTIIKGVDFSGNPFSGSFSVNLFKRAVDGGLFVTLHCAEVKNEKEVKEIVDFKPHRIGHGTFLHPQYGGSDEIWRLYCLARIPLECCLTSNILCGTAKNYKDHHVQEWIKDSLPFTLCTDDKGVFGTSLSQEMVLALQHLNLSQENLWNITYNSIDFTFASDDEKVFLRKKLQEWKSKNHF